MDQKTLNDLIEKHELYREDDVDGEQLVLEGQDLSSLDISHAPLIGVVLRKCKMVGIDASACDLTDAQITDSDLTDANLRAIDAKRASFLRCNLSACDLSYAEANEAEFVGSDLTDAECRECKLSKSDLEDVTATRANFSGAELDGCNFADVDLRNAKFNDADLEEADLNGADVEGADFRDADARYANLRVVGEPEWTTGINVQGALVCGSPFHPLLKMQLEEALEAIGVDYKEPQWLAMPGTGTGQKYIALIDEQHQGEWVLVPVRSAHEAIVMAAENCDDEMDPLGALEFWGELAEDDLSDGSMRYQYAQLVEEPIDNMTMHFEGISVEDAERIMQQRESPTFVVEPSKTGVWIQFDEFLDSYTIEQLHDAAFQSEEKLTAYGRARKAAKESEKVTEPIKPAKLKKLFPSAFELVKHDIGAGVVTPAKLRSLIKKHGLEWDVRTRKYTNKTQRLSPEPNTVLQLNVNPESVTSDEETLKTIEAIRQTSLQSGHPVRQDGPVTIGWVRYTEFDEPDVLLIEEIQSDLPIVRKGLSDEEFQAEMKKAGVTEEQIRKGLDVLQPFVDRFYADAISLVYDIAAERGKHVEMLSYTQKQQFDSPRSLYEKLPKMMGMRKIQDSRLDFIGGPVWTITPNPRRKRRGRARKLPRSFRWSRKKGMN